MIIISLFFQQQQKINVLVIHFVTEKFQLSNKKRTLNSKL